jgi:hypothetical protein
MSTVFLLLVGLLAQAPAPPTQPAKPMGPPLSAFVGRWQGRCEGEPGQGTSERTYEYALRGKFLNARNRTTFPPQAKNPKGETHEDVGYFSYDRSRKLLVLRQFHVEGFVNQYVEEAGGQAGAMAFVSEALENTPPGWRARESYVFDGPDTFTETFELAEAGKPFAVYTKTKFKRVTQ